MICIECKKNKPVTSFYIGYCGNPRNQCKKCYSALVYKRRVAKKKAAKAAKLAEFKEASDGYGKNGKRAQSPAHSALNIKHGKLP